MALTLSQYRPTADWIIARKRPSQDAPSHAVIHGVVRVNPPAPHHYADVIAVGPGRLHHSGVVPSPPCAPGDCVMIRAAAGDPETIEGVEYHWMIPDEVLAVVAPLAPALPSLPFDGEEGG